MYFDNPAGHLLTILERGRDLDVNTNCKAAWSEILSAETDAELLSRLGKIMLLPSQTLMLFDSVGKLDETTHEHWTGQVLKAFFAQNLDGVWESFINHIDNHTITNLKMTDQILELQKTIQNPSEDEIERIRADVIDLLDKVRESNLEGEIKRHLMRSLQRIVGAIREYSLFGIVPVIDAVESTIGHAAADSSYAKIITEELPVFWEILHRIATLLTIITGSEKLLDFFKNPLLEKVE